MLYGDHRPASSADLQKAVNELKKKDVFSPNSSQMTLNSGEILLQCRQTRHRSHWNAHYSSRSTKTENGRRDATKAKFYLALNGLKNKVKT